MAGFLPVPAGLVELARQRLRAAGDIIREQAARHGAICLDTWAIPVGPELFGPDRIHPNAAGHRLIAAAFADLLLPGRG
jgi:lysophospholipase L1-like esterase